MKMLLAIAGICGLVGLAYSVGSSGSAVPGDPFEGFDLDLRARTKIGITCRRRSGRDEPPPRACVEAQVAALRKYERMRETYPRRSKGAMALKRCWTDGDRALKTDYVAVTECAERRIGRM